MSQWTNRCSWLVLPHFPVTRQFGFHEILRDWEIRGSWKKMQTFWFLVLQFLGCLPFTKSSEKFGWKVNRTRLFGSAFQRKISGNNGTSEKLVLFSRSEYSKRKFRFHSFKAIYDTSFSFSRPFFGKCSWLVQMVNSIPGGNFSVLNFAYDFIPKPWTDRFAHVNGKQPRLLPYIFSSS